MSLSVGIVGLPNVGKSTLFNTLTNSQVEAQNYPFCTIEPNKGIVPVVDNDLERISEVSKSKNIIFSTVEFLDIAGLVKGAAEGAGLGNKFLGNIKEVDLILHVVRAFEDDNVTHVDGRVSPLEDIKTIELELILKDLELVARKHAEIARLARNKKDQVPILELLDKIKSSLEDEQMLYKVDLGELSEDQAAYLKSLNLITIKKVLFCINGAPGMEIPQELADYTGKENYILLDIKIENEISTLDEEDKEIFMDEYGLKEVGLNKLVRKSFEMLGLIAFFTSGPEESRAWTIKNGTDIVNAAGVIHNDIKDNFIAADVVNVEDFIAFDGWEGVKTNGKIRLEGKGYVVKHKDIIYFRHNS